MELPALKLLKEWAEAAVKCSIAPSEIATFRSSYYCTHSVSNLASLLAGSCSSVRVRSGMEDGVEWHLGW